MNKTTARSGQIGLVILLVMVVVSTIGLSVASRSTQEVTTSRQSQEAAKTFAAAESAIERILSDSEGDIFLFDSDSRSLPMGDLATDTTVDVSIDKVYRLETNLKEGVTAEVDVTGAVSGDLLRIEWADSRDCGTQPASLVVQVVNDDGSNVSTRYLALGLCNQEDDNFTLHPDIPANRGTTHALRYDLSLADNDIKVRIIPVYNDTPLTVSADWDLPAQQFRITSVGQNLAEGGREAKAVQVERTQPQLPGIFDFALVSGETIEK